MSEEVMDVVELPVKGYWVDEVGNGWRRISGGIPTPLDAERYMLYPGSLAHIRDKQFEWTPLGIQQMELGRLDVAKVRELADV